MEKREIYGQIKEMQKRVQAAADMVADAVSVLEYRYLVTYTESGEEIWTAALQTAIAEHAGIRIPAKDTPYYLDDSILVPSNRKILAEKQAVIRLLPDVSVLMLRNVHTEDGTHHPISGTDPDENITIIGGIWEESRSGRLGYGGSGRYAKEAKTENGTEIEQGVPCETGISENICPDRFYGVSTCMLFNNIKGLTLRDMEFVHTAGFSVQIGDASDLVLERIRFRECFADGLHINGNCKDILIRDISGQVGDDLVALNMYDWQNSSVNFGPLQMLVCENLDLSADSRYKAMRIQPGIYRYADGSLIDCSISDAIIKNVRGINTFKLYLQTPPYKVTETHEFGGPGSADNLYFEDIEIDLNRPIDGIEEYMQSHPVLGSIAGFELGSRIGSLFFQDITIKLYKEKFPMSFFLCIGPKSIRRGETEIFDPYVDSFVKELHLENVRILEETVAKGELAVEEAITRDNIAIVETVLDKNVKEIGAYIHCIAFDDYYGDGTATGSGKIQSIQWSERRNHYEPDQDQ